MRVSEGVRKIFAEVPRTYELVNHLLTFGMDMVWRRRAVRIAVKDGGSRWLDVCSGTGETAIYLSRRAPVGTDVYAVDFSEPMLRQAALKPAADCIEFVQADADDLPFADDSLDLVTISFATRNINTSRNGLLRCFREFHRVLRPGGRFVNLETSQPSSRLLRSLLHTYVRLIVRRLGSAISGSDAAYSYLASTIPRFYRPEELSGLLEESGFASAPFKRLLFGVAAVHVAVKDSTGSADEV